MSRLLPAKVLALFYERRLKTSRGLSRELRHLDSDAGIRLRGWYKERPCFVFVTRFLRSYTVMVYDRLGGGGGQVGRRVLSKDYSSLAELEEFLSNVSGPRVDAYAY